MVLRDRMFHNMELNDMVDVLRPKVDGTKYLDELFSENNLDFFILFSSITCVVGNSGQSNYIAANMFMTSLAAQRKSRGLAGSVIDISSLVGIGYVERSNTFDAEYFSKVGYTDISEQDLHQMFAEAILVGRPESEECPEIVTGFAPAYADAEIKAPYRSDLKFCHFILERPGDKLIGSQAAVVSVKIQLSTSKTRGQVHDALKGENLETCLIENPLTFAIGSFVARLRKILQIPAEDELSQTMALVELGVDSLVAVEVRSWFLKELDIDMRVLKVLGGASIDHLLEDAMERLPAYLVPNLTSSDEPASASAVEIWKGESSKDEPTSTEPSSDSASAVDSMSQRGDDTVAETPMSSPKSEPEARIEEVKPMHSPEITEKMSFGQSRFWFLNHFLRDPTTFNMAFSVRLEGSLRVDDLAKAVRAVSQKHEALRTRFFSVGKHMEQPMQGILDSSLIHLKQKSITDEAQADQELKDMRAHVWNLEHWETMRITLLSLSKTTHYMLVGCHHIAMDGVSFQIFFADLEKAYMGRTLSPCPADSQYRAFSALQHQEYKSGNMEADIEFYRGIIPKNPEPLPLFPFARTASRKTLDMCSLHRADFRLDPVLTARIKDRSRKHRATTFHFYLAVLQTLLFRLLGNADDFFIGIADANRTDSKFMGTLGFFLNLLPIRFERGSAKVFSEALHDTRDKAYSALSHSKLPFDVLLNRLNIKRSATHTPLFQVFVDYRQGVQERTTFADCKAHGESWHIAKTGYDLTLDIIENVAGDSLLTLKLQESLYSRHDTEMLLQTYLNLLMSFAMNPDVPLVTPSLWQKVNIDRAIELGRGQGLS
jgi:hybrid polyketide synthase/nonribosomal peptide synthetase ACE1